MITFGGSEFRDICLTFHERPAAGTADAGRHLSVPIGKDLAIREVLRILRMATADKPGGYRSSVSFCRLLYCWGVLPFLRTCRR